MPVVPVQDPPPLTRRLDHFAPANRARTDEAAVIPVAAFEVGGMFADEVVKAHGIEPPALVRASSAICILRLAAISGSGFAMGLAGSRSQRPSAASAKAVEPRWQLKKYVESTVKLPSGKREHGVSLSPRACMSDLGDAPVLRVRGRDG